jgi:NADH:ubiquinone oxidoreductase subunit K
MQIEFYLALAATLVGVGIGSALSRRNILAVVMSIVIAGTGAVIAMSTFDFRAGRYSDGMLFALCLGIILLVFVVLGCVLAYRRFCANGTTSISERNQLRH